MAGHDVHSPCHKGLSIIFDIYFTLAFICHTVDSYFKKLSHIIQSKTTIPTPADIFLFFFIQSFANKTAISITPIIAALDSVRPIAKSHNKTNKILIFANGFLSIFFIFCIPFPRHKNINGKNATRKYP
jgi:hypothetical protein